MTIKTNQLLEAVSISIKPLQESPITKEFFNGEGYTGTDGNVYPGYSAVVIGTISSNEEDENYLSDEDFTKLAIDAYYDVDAYVNKAMTVLGMFQPVANFSSIPVLTRDHMMRSIAAKIEQNLFTNPSNAEIRVTLTQNSGGRTTNLPARENFNPSDMLNQKVQEYINGSMIFEVLADSFQAILLDRNDYYTKGEINAIIQTGNVPIERLYTLDVENYEPTEDGDGVNKKYVDILTNDLQEQINALIVGDVMITTNNIQVKSMELESITGLESTQRGVNTENKIVLNQLRNSVRELNKRTGVPLQAHKTSAQFVKGIQYNTIEGYDAEGAGTVDSLGGMNEETGTYTIQVPSEGDQVQFTANFTVLGKPLPNQVLGYATIQKNGETVLHPTTGNSLEIPIQFNTIAGNVFSIVVDKVNIRDGEVNDDWKSGDLISLAVKQSATGFAAGVPLQVEDVSFSMANLRVLAESGIHGGSGAVDSTQLEIIDSANESLSGLAISQSEVNKENKVKFGEVAVLKEEINSLRQELKTLKQEVK